MVSPPITVSDRSGRVETTSRGVATEADRLLHPSRLDILVHLRALEDVSRSPEPASAPAASPWLDRSVALIDGDAEPGVADLAALLRTPDRLPDEVAMGPGGLLASGATVTAAALFGGRAVRRTDVTTAGPRLSQGRLARAGYTRAELRELVMTLLRHVDDAAVVLIDHGAEEGGAAVHEFERRYERFYAELDHVSPADARALRLDGFGSVELLALRVNPGGLADVVFRHRQAVLAAGLGDRAVELADGLFSPDRRPSTSSQHRRVVWSRRRRRLAVGALATARSTLSR